MYSLEKLLAHLNTLGSEEMQLKLKQLEVDEEPKRLSPRSKMDVNILPNNQKDISSSPAPLTLKQNNLIKAGGKNTE